MNYVSPEGKALLAPQRAPVVFTRVKKSYQPNHDGNQITFEVMT